MLATEILRSFFIHFFCKKTIRKKKKKNEGNIWKWSTINDTRFGLEIKSYRRIPIYYGMRISLTCKLAPHSKHFFLTA